MHSSGGTSRDGPEPLNERLSQFRGIRRAQINVVPGSTSTSSQSTQNISSQLPHLQVQIQSERPHIRVARHQLERIPRRQLFGPPTATAPLFINNTVGSGTFTQSTEISSNLINNPVEDLDSNQNLSSQYLLKCIDEPLTEADQEILDINRANRSSFLQELFLSMLNSDDATKETIIDTNEDDSPLNKLTRTSQLLTQVKTPDTEQQITDGISLPNFSQLPLEKIDHVTDTYQIGVPQVNQNIESIISSQISNHSSSCDVQEQRDGMKRKTSVEGHQSLLVQTRTSCVFNEVITTSTEREADNTPSLQTSLQIPLEIMEHVTDTHQISTSLINQFTGSVMSTQISEFSPVCNIEEQNNVMEKITNAEEGDSLMKTSAQNQTSQVLIELMTPEIEQSQTNSTQSSRCSLQIPLEMTDRVNNIHQLDISLTNQKTESVTSSQIPDYSPACDIHGQYIVIEETNTEEGDSLLMLTAQTQTPRILTEVTISDTKQQQTDSTLYLPSSSQQPLEVIDHVTDIHQISVLPSKQTKECIMSSQISDRSSAVCVIEEEQNAMRKTRNAEDSDSSLTISAQTVEILDGITIPFTEQRQTDNTFSLPSYPQQPLEITDHVTNIHQIGVLVTNQNIESVMSPQIPDNSTISDVQEQPNGLMLPNNRH